jgi:hypothetical protein
MATIAQQPASQAVILVFSADIRQRQTHFNFTQGSSAPEMKKKQRRRRQYKNATQRRGPRSSSSSRR